MKTIAYTLAILIVLTFGIAATGQAKVKTTTATLSSIKPATASQRPIKKVALTAKPVKTVASSITTTAKTTPVAQPAQPVVNQASSDVSANCYYGLISQYNWNVSIMLAIAHAESGCDASKIGDLSPDGVLDYGLFQLHGEDIMDPAANVQAAYNKWLEQGYGAWTSYNTGFYREFL